MSEGADVLMGEGTGVLERKERVALSYVRRRYLIGCHRVNLMPVRIGVLMLFEFSDFRSQVTPQAQNIEIVGTEYDLRSAARVLPRMRTAYADPTA